MTGVVRTPSVYAQIQFEGETDEQFRDRATAIEESNRRADEIEKAWAPSPMKGLRQGWDCGCWFSCTFRGGKQHPFCPRK